jgi:uncharacterized OsmC-like protein
MRILIRGEQEIVLEPGGADLEIEAAAPGLHFSPLHMLAASLATCTYAVLAGWAERAEIDVADLRLGITWDYVEDPYRVGEFRMALVWPGLPEPRRAAALQVASHCTVEHTLLNPPRIQTAFDRAG